MTAGKILVVGLGNPILGDDGVGWRVVEEISKVEFRNSTVEVDCLALGGLSLMERLIGYQRAILVDAIQTGQNPPGTISRFQLEELPAHAAGHTTAAHDTSLRTAIQLGRSMGASLPKEIIIIGIEAEKVYDFTEELTPPVAEAVPRAIQLVLEILQANGG